MIEQEENELLCEKLLGWSRGGDEWWHNGQLQCYTGDTPTFLTGDGMLLLIEALHRLPHVSFEVWNCDKGWRCRLLDMERMNAIHETCPAAVRAAALAYVRSLQA